MSGGPRSSALPGFSLSKAFLRTTRSAHLLIERRLLGQRFLERRVHDYRLVLDAHDPGLSRQLLRDGAREPEQKFILERELRPGMNVFDLGANLGYYTVMMARRIGPAGRIYAVEPVGRNFTLLRRNIAVNGLDNVTAEQLAIADVTGSKPLLLTAQSNWHSFHRPQVDAGVPWLRKYKRQIIGEIVVPTRTLADYLADKPTIALLRMDLEGYELEILRSLRALPRAAAEMRVLFETHPEFYGDGERMRQLLAGLDRDCGLRIKYLVSDFQFGSRRHSEIEPARRVFERRGYGSNHIVRQFHNRAVYADVRQDDAIELIAASEHVNAALLAAR